MSNSEPDFYEDRAEERKAERIRPSIAQERRRQLEAAENAYEHELDRLGGSR